MGGDGGSIPGRQDLVYLKKKRERVEKNVDLAAKWQHCALTQEPLRSPIVACELGRLYNKDRVIELLLDRGKFEDPAKVSHITGLKDLKELNLTPNPEYKATDDKAESYVTRACPYICPITGLEMTGVYKFQFLWYCGCVFSERALKEMKSVTCNKCGKEMKKTDVITLNGDDEEVTALHNLMHERRLQAKLDKKSKKKKKAEARGTAEGEPPSKERKLDETKSGPSEKPSTSKGKKGSSTSTSKLQNTKDKKYKSLQDDPNASQVYKNLFSSGKDAKKKGSAHWVTYNPFYN